jgi:hypothetical protein
MDRRALLHGGLAGSLAANMAIGPASAAAPSPVESRFVTFASVEEEFKAHFRFERDLRDEGDALTWYHFTVFALPEGAKPAPIVRFEGMEYSYFRKVGPLTWRIHAHNLSFPRAVSNGAFVDRVTNPLNNLEVQVPTMRLLDDPGVLYSPRGYLQLDSAAGLWRPAYRLFRIQGEHVVVDHIRGAPENWPKVFMEASTSWVSRKAFDDPRVTSLPCGVSGFYTFPYPAWMRMGDAPGRMLGSWFGKKMASPAELPVEFRERVAQEDPALLKPRRALLDSPLPEAARRALAENRE